MSDQLLSRNIPATIRRQLRQEVNYGCPVEKCGSPFLSYHHFDPPWHEENHHNPNGMIAMCLHHHKAADNGAYTNDQLRKLKITPFIKEQGLVFGQLAWKREKILFDVGGSYFFGATLVYVTMNEPMIWLKFDTNGNIMINFDIKDKDGDLVFSMRDNDWVLSTNLDDIESPPAMKKIAVKDKNKGIRFLVEFKSYSKLKFQEKYRDRMRAHYVKDLLNRIDEDQIVICEVRGLLKYPFHIHMKDFVTDMKNAVGPFSMYGGAVQIQKGALIKEASLSNNYVVGDGVLVS